MLHFVFLSFSHIPMFLSASLEQLNEIETPNSPMTPPPALRFKASQARKIFQRRRTSPELQQPLVSPLDRRRRKRSVRVYKQQGKRDSLLECAVFRDRALVLDLFTAIENRDFNSVATILRDSDINFNESVDVIL